MGGQQPGTDATTGTDNKLHVNPGVDNHNAFLSTSLDSQDALSIIRQQRGGGGSDLTDGSILKNIHISDDPFNKPFDAPAEKDWGKKWDQFMHGQHTIDDQAREREISRLTPDQRKAYEKEEQEMKAYWTRMDLNGKPPDTPMHDQVNQNVAKFEQQSKDKALAQLTPAERQQYDQEQRDEAKRFDDWLKNPGLAPPPEGKHPITDKVNKLTQLEAETDLTLNPTGFPESTTKNPDGSITHKGATDRDDYTEKTDNGKTTRTYTNGTKEETDSKTGTTTVSLTNGDTISIDKDGNSTYTSSSFFRGDSRTPVHYKSKDEALQHARDNYEFPEEQSPWDKIMKGLKGPDLPIGLDRPTGWRHLPQAQIPPDWKPDLRMELQE
jgi:hypothetical protein